MTDHSLLPDDQPMDDDAVAAIVRITGGLFRLLARLLTQMGRLMESRDPWYVPRSIVEAAREGRASALPERRINGGRGGDTQCCAPPMPGLDMLSHNHT